MSYKSLNITVLALAIIFGVYFSFGEHFAKFVSERNPAAIRKSYDYTTLQEEDIQKNIKDQLLQEAQLKKGPAGYSIAFGQFQFQMANGYTANTCEQYKKVILTFVGDGMATSGEVPQMQVEGDCISDPQSEQKTTQIEISVESLAKSKPNDGDYSFTSNTRLNLSNMGEAWPTAWSLQSIQFVDPTGVYADIKISNQEINQYFQKPVVMDWRTWLHYEKQ